MNDYCQCTLIGCFTESLFFKFIFSAFKYAPKYSQIRKIQYLGRIIECAKYIPEKILLAHLEFPKKGVFVKHPTAYSDLPPILVILWVCPLLSCSPLWGSVVWTVSNIANFSSISILFSNFSHLRVKMYFCFNLSSFCTFLILLTLRVCSVSHCNLLACFL